MVWLVEEFGDVRGDGRPDDERRLLLFIVVFGERADSLVLEAMIFVKDMLKNEGVEC